MTITTFSLPATTLKYPAITICKRYKYDVGEYLRSVFNNFETACDLDVDGDCNRTHLLRSHFPKLAKFRVYPPLG